MSNPKISVIMPAYNAEKYIRDSVTSILNQTIKNLELIVVDDGSKDNTRALLDELAAADDRLRAVTVPNGGPANARNKGLDMVSPDTDYIMFCDADDRLLPDAAEKALLAAADGVDLVLFGFTITNPDGTTNDYCEPSAVYTPTTIGPQLANLYKANLLNQVWAKLFRADLILENHLRFADYRWGEDRLFIYDCLERMLKLAVLQDCLYLYVMHEGESLISGYYDKKPEICVLADRRMRELCAHFGTPDNGFFRYMFMKGEFSCLTNLYSPSCRLNDEEKRAYASRILNNAYVIERCENVEGGAAAKAVSKVMTSGNVSMALEAAKAATAVGRTAPKLFQKLKHKK